MGMRDGQLRPDLVAAVSVWRARRNKIAIDTSAHTDLVAIERPGRTTRNKIGNSKPNRVDLVAGAAS
jgi:hypothetical protein